MRWMVRSIVGLLVVPGLAPATLEGQDPEIKEWLVPWAESRPRDPFFGPDQKVWFVGQRSHYVASMDPATGTFERFDLDDGVGPHNVIVDEDGTPWYAGNLAHHIGKLDPRTGEVTQYMMPDDRARDPHTLVFDSKGGIWFTVQGGNFVGHLQKETGEVRLVEMPQAQTPNGLTSSRPYGIKLDAQGVPWIVLFNTNKIVSVDPQNLAVRAFELPEGARPRRLEITADQMVWYVDYAQGRLSRLDPSTGEVKEWPTPGGERSRPYGMAKDHLDRLWFVESGIRPNRFVGFNPRTETFFSSQELESGGGTVRHMFFDQATRAVWFGTDTNTVGRAIIPG